MVIVIFQNRSVFLQAHRTYDCNESTGSLNKRGLCGSPLFIFLNAQFHINHKGT